MPEPKANAVSNESVRRVSMPSLIISLSTTASIVCFFVFVGNFARIDAVRDFFSSVLKGREGIVAALLSQGISNVPAAVMLSGFTEKGRELLLGVNIGGMGTVIASLASLISFQYYRKAENVITYNFAFKFNN